MNPEINGLHYDWRKTDKPEQPYHHQYHLSITDKIFLCTKSDPKEGTPARVHCTFEQALERIRKIDNMTRGIPKIMYLVGWQFEGHDSKYPAWSEVNKLLKRPDDKTALDSLLWLMNEGYRYNTTVSLHVNMNDAYDNSPLWNLYKEKGVIVKKGGEWGGEQSYLISHLKEWESGLAQKRIDDLIEMLLLEKAGTIHIDAFWMVDDNGKEELAIMRKIIRYWRSKGVDVTIEGLVQPDHDNALIGLVPMVWHINNKDWGRGDELTEKDYMEIPASLFCGGMDHTQRSVLFGTNMIGEDISNDRIHDYLSRFCLNTLPWQYLNHYERQQLIEDGNTKEVKFSAGLISRVIDGKPFIKHGNVTLRDGNDVFVPALWKDKEIIAFSSDGYDKRRWVLPSSWHEVDKVCINEINTDGQKFLQEISIVDGTIELSLKPNTAVSILPI
jgi:hypothetical protein